MNYQQTMGEVNAYMAEIGADPVSMDDKVLCWPINAFKVMEARIFELEQRVKMLEEGGEDGKESEKKETD
jgi:hypothetical protein